MRGGEGKDEGIASCHALNQIQDDRPESKSVVCWTRSVIKREGHHLLS